MMEGGGANRCDHEREGGGEEERRIHLRRCYRGDAGAPFTGDVAVARKILVYYVVLVSWKGG